MGGILLAGKEQGRRAGEIALQVLAGEDPSRIPVDMKSTARPMFDYRQLSRFQIPISALPPGSIINQPDSFYGKHKSLVLGIMAVLAGLIMVIIVLTMNINKRKRAEEALSQNLLELQETVKKLEQSRNMLQLIIESIPVRVFWKDRDLRYLGCNTLFARDAGLNNPRQLLGKDDFAMGWRDQADLYRADDRQVMESRRPKLNIIEPQTTPRCRNLAGYQQSPVAKS